LLYLLPGLLCDETVWRSQRAALAVETKVADFRGFDSLTAMAQSVLDQAPARFAVAGHSMGGRVALEIMRLAPERVDRLALLDTGIHPTREGEAAKRKVLVDLARKKGMRAMSRLWLEPMVHPARIADDALMLPLLAMVERMSPDHYAGQIKALVDRRDAAPILPIIACPTLVAVGRQDAWSAVAQHEEIAAAVAGARLVVFEECGHMSTVERPDAVSAALADWLA